MRKAALFGDVLHAQVTVIDQRHSADHANPVVVLQRCDAEFLLEKNAEVVGAVAALLAELLQGLVVGSAVIQHLLEFAGGRHPKRIAMAINNVTQNIIDAHFGAELLEKCGLAEGLVHPQ